MATAISRAPSQSSPIPIKACSQCSVTDKRLSVCGRCHIEKYCGRACQAAAWPKHKQVCIQSAKKEVSSKKSTVDDFKPLIGRMETVSKNAHPVSSTQAKEKPTSTVKSIEDMTAKEYLATLTVADARLPTGERDRFWIRNEIRRVCRFFPKEPYKHIYICFKSWSKEIEYFGFFEDSSLLDKHVEEGVTCMKFSNNKEFEMTVDRLFPDFLVNSWGSYSVNFSDSDMRRACTRHNWKGEYFVSDPDD